MVEINTNKKIIIVGGGLAGSLLSIYLAKQGFEIVVYEKQPDMRIAGYVGGRSINLALSPRGILPLQEVEVFDKIKEIALPMKGRLMHSIDGKKTFQPYGKDQDKEFINSVSRGELNKLLVLAAEETKKVSFRFNTECTGINLDSGEISLKDNSTGAIFNDNGQTILSTDGAGSVIRYSLIKLPRFNFSQEFLEHGYKELEISTDKNGNHKIENNVLHIWPRGGFMMIALPNPNGTFTATLFHPYQGYAGFDELDTKEKVAEFFKQNYPDVIDLIPDYIEQFFKNPIGILGTIRCNPWYFKDKVLLLGDASHAIVPFYGQGMNAAFEDCRIFNNLLTKYGADWRKIFHEFNTMRKSNTDAIAELALDNFIEMRDRVADERFLLLKKAELILYEKYPEIVSKYSMVTFTHIPYSEAKTKGEILHEVLSKYLESLDSIDDFDHESAYKEIIERYKKLNF
jgi:kynurenine 3-monooxygenase